MVTDPHDARINKAKILIVRKDFKREVVTDEEGFFQIDLPEGTYLISASAYGFGPVNRKRIYIKANAVIAINLKLWPKAFID